MLQQANQRFTTKTYDCLQKHALWIPILLFFCTYVLMYLKLGIKISGDSQAYIEGAKRLLTGLPLIDIRSKRTIGYEIIVALNYGLKFGNIGVITSQVIINALATVALYDLGRRLYGRATGILAASLYVANPDVVQWTFIVMTDSVYTAGLILSCWAFYRIQMNPNSIFKLTLVAILWVYVAVIRPNGWFMLPLFVVLLIIDLMNKGSFKSVKYFLVLLIMLSALALWGPSFTGITQYNPAQQATVQQAALPAAYGLWPVKDLYYHLLINGVVIFAYPETYIKMPISEMNAEPGYISYLLYCVKHPFDSINLFLHRIFTSIIFSRPDYSTLHNAIINLGYPIIYLLALTGVIIKKHELLTWLMISIVVVQLIIIGLTLAHYDSRYWVYVIPLITMYSSIGVIASIKLLVDKIKLIS